MIIVIILYLKRKIFSENQFFTYVIFNHLEKKKEHMRGREVMFIFFSDLGSAFTFRVKR